VPHAGQGYQEEHEKKNKITLFIQYACDPKRVTADQQMTGFMAAHMLEGYDSYQAMKMFEADEDFFSKKGILDKAAPHYQRMLTILHDEAAGDEQSEAKLFEDLKLENYTLEGQSKKYSEFLESTERETVFQEEEGGGSSEESGSTAGEETKRRSSEPMEGIEGSSGLEEEVGSTSESLVIELSTITSEGEVGISTGATEEGGDSGDTTEDVGGSSGSMEEVASPSGSVEKGGSSSGGMGKGGPSRAGKGRRRSSKILGLEGYGDEE
jgi:hypothetical protein